MISYDQYLRRLRRGEAEEDPAFQALVQPLIDQLDQINRLVSAHISPVVAFDAIRPPSRSLAGG